MRARCSWYCRGRQGYIVADESGVMSPIEWARKAVRLYKFWNADRIVAEVNNGGALVEIIWRAVDHNIPFRGVHASKNKVTRAEPIAALFDGLRPPGRDVPPARGSAHKLQRRIIGLARPSRRYGLGDDRAGAQRPAPAVHLGRRRPPDELEIARRHLSTDHYHP